MNDQHLSQLLSDISEERIPDDMDLWNAIQEQIDTPQNVRRVRKTRGGWLLAAVIAIMITGVVAVLAQGGGDDDDDTIQDGGIQSASEQGLLTELNLTQTDGDVSVTIDYAYADANRVTVAYSGQITTPADNQSIVSFSESLGENLDIALSPVASGGGGGGGGGGGNAPDDTQIRTMQSIESYNVLDVYESDTLTLVYNVDAYIYEPDQTPFSSDVEPVASFTFEFEIPFYQGSRYSQPQTVNVNGIDLTLQEVVVAPSMTRLVLCYDVPVDENGFPWQAQIELLINDDTVENDLSWIAFPTFATPTLDTGCFDYFVTESLMGYVDDTWTLTVPFLYGGGFAVNISDFISRLEAEGIEVIDGALFPDATADNNTIIITQVDGGVSIIFGGIATEGEAIVDIDSIIDDAYVDTAEKIEGPWQFSFSLDE